MKLRNVFIILALGLHANAQNYFVSRVAGTVFNNNSRIKQGDSLSMLAKLTAAEPTAMLRVVNSAVGALVVSFNNGSLVIKEVGGKPSEFYELVLKDYIEKYQKYKSLSTKTFELQDWFDCFVKASDDSVSHRVLIVSGDKASFHTRNFVSDRGYMLLVCKYHGDSVCERVPVVADSMHFSENIFKPGERLLVKFKVTDGRGKDTFAVTDHFIDCVVLSRTMLNNLAPFFRGTRNMDDRLDGGVNKEMYDFIQFNFGIYFSPYVDKLLRGNDQDGTKR